MDIRREKIVFKDHVTHRAYVTLDNGHVICVDQDNTPLSDEEAYAQAKIADIPPVAEAGLEAQALLAELEALIDE